MTAFVLPNLDESTIKELRKRIPDMSEIDLPNLEKVGKDVGKTADQALDKLLGRSKMPVWPWVAGSIALAAILGAVAAWFTWFRRPGTIDTIVDEEITSWSAPTDGSGLGTEYQGGLGADSTTGVGTDTGTGLGDATDQALDRSTSGAIGTFAERPADEYPTA
jgi:hypothetical protein